MKNIKFSSYIEDEEFFMFSSQFITIAIIISFILAILFIKLSLSHSISNFFWVGVGFGMFPLFLNITQKGIPNIRCCKTKLSIIYFH